MSDSDTLIPPPSVVRDRLAKHEAEVKARAPC